ncbi:MAG: hypothetical protein Q9166_000494 [cf. Caloplaca sp. 2 TL-2023]
MLIKSFYPRRRGALIVLLISALLLTKHVYKQTAHSGIKPLISRQPSLETTSTFENRNITLPPGRQEHSFDFSIPATTLIATKRALPSRWHSLVCLGEDFWDHAIQPAFKKGGHSQFPTPTFGQNAFADNGWNFEHAPGVEAPPPGWLDALHIIPGGQPKEEEAVLVLIDQIFRFTNEHATGAKYHGLMFPRSQSGIIISTDTYGPSFQVTENGVPKDQVSRHIPRLNQLSDALWEAWKRVDNDPGHLRYYGVDTIKNKEASPLMDEIFQSRRGSLRVPWEERLTFSLQSDEGKALLASQSGRAIAWLMIHHAAELGERTPRVTIFTLSGNHRCMLWDLIPKGQQGSFGEPEALSEEEKAKITMRRYLRGR